MRALLSVYDKSGIVDLGRGLHDLGWELVSSSNTARALRDAGLPVTEVADVTGVAEMLGHRVVTLHPNIHGGLLADLDNPEHVADLERHGITPIGLVVSNLYPFVERPDVETIDIGGPAMVRAAAKNHAHVAVVVDPADYDAGARRAPPRRCDLAATRGAHSRGRRSRTRPRTTRPSPRGSATATMCFRRRCH